MHRSFFAVKDTFINSGSDEFDGTTREAFAIKGGNSNSWRKDNKSRNVKVIGELNSC